MKKKCELYPRLQVGFLQLLSVCFTNFLIKSLKKLLLKKSFLQLQLTFRLNTIKMQIVSIVMRPIFYLSSKFVGILFIYDRNREKVFKNTFE